MKYLWPLLLMSAVIGDIITTNIGLKMGYVETNLFFNWMIDKFGLCMASIIKIISFMILCMIGLSLKYEGKVIYICLTIIFVIMIISNLAVIL